MIADIRGIIIYMKPHAEPARGPAAPRPRAPGTRITKTSNITTHTDLYIERGRLYVREL